MPVDLTYPVIVAAAKTWFRLSAMDIHMSGTEHIPTSGGALVAVNHVSYVDYLMGGYPGAQRGRYTRFMAKKEIFANPVGGPFMRSFGHLEVDREAGAGEGGHAPRSTPCARASWSGSSPRPRSPRASSSRTSSPGRCGSPPTPTSR